MSMRRAHRSTRAALCALVLLAAAGTAAPPAQAQGAHLAKKAPPKVVKPGDPGSSQYQEDVPSAFGSVPASSVASSLPPAPTAGLPSGVAKQLGDDGAAGRGAAALAVAGTPATVGARPGRSAHRHGGGGSGGSGGAAAAQPVAKGVLASLADSIAGEDGGIGVLLPILLSASALIVLAVVVRRRRRGS